MSTAILVHSSYICLSVLVVANCFCVNAALATWPWFILHPRCFCNKIRNKLYLHMCFLQLSPAISIASYTKPSGSYTHANKKNTLKDEYYKRHIAK